MTYLKSLANKYEALDGQIIFWMLPYQSLRYQVARDALDQIVPQFKWVNAKESTETFGEPAEWKAAQIRAAQTRQTAMTDWQRVDLWDTYHRVFTYFEGLVIDIEFALADDAMAEYRALQMYWQLRGAGVSGNWLNFVDLMGSRAITLFYDAYDATRDKSMTLAPEDSAPIDGDTDPEAGGGETST